MVEISEFKQGWALVVAEFFVVFLVDGVSFTFGLYLVAFLDEFGENRLSTAFVGSIGFGVQYILGPVSGSIVDRFESRPLIIIGTLISFAGFFASSFAKSIPVMCLSYGLLGGFGTFTMSLLVNYLISEFGWRRALFITSGLLLNGIPCALLLVSPSKDKQENHNGSAVGSRTELIHMFDGFKHTVRQISHLLKDRRCICFMMSAFFVGLAFTIPASILPDQVTQAGMSQSDASWLVSSIGLSNVIGRIVVGFVSDKVPKHRIYIYVCMVLLQGLSISLMPLFQTFKTKLVLTSVFGLAMGGYIVLFGVVQADAFGIERIGKTYGLNIFTFGIASCFAVPLAGWIFDVSNNYDLSFYVGGGDCVLATMCLLAPGILSYFNL